MPTVLIIEDNERNRRLARDVLEYGGFSTLVAESAEAGLEIVAAEHPDVILLDIQLPGMDGMAALARLRDDPATAATPVIALTAFAMGGDRDRMLDAGFDDYVAKPIDIDGLLASVRDACAAADGSAR